TVICSEAEVTREKMQNASLPREYIFAAMDALQAYRSESLTPRYFSPKDRRLIDHEVQAELHDLLSKFDSGVLTDSSLEFYNICLSRLRDLQTELQIDPSPTISYLYGCMYFISG